jgi:uncharacterized membrane protein
MLLSSYGGAAPRENWRDTPAHALIRGTIGFIASAGVGRIVFTGRVKAARQRQQELEEKFDEAGEYLESSGIQYGQNRPFEKATLARNLAGPKGW